MVINVKVECVEMVSESIQEANLQNSTLNPHKASYGLALLRSALYNFCFFIILPALLVVNAPMLLASKPPFYVAKWVNALALWFAKVICGLDYRVIGHENVPAGACIFASKHQSAWDTMVFLSLFPTAAYALKQELTRIPIYGNYIRKFGMISIDRKRGLKAIIDLKDQAKSIISQDRRIVIFPEGSRTAVGEQAPYQKGIYALYKDCDCPIVPVALNSGVFWPRRSWIKWPGTITLQFLEPMPQGLDADQFMELLRERIESASGALLTHNERM